MSLGYLVIGLSRIVNGKTLIVFLYKDNPMKLSGPAIMTLYGKACVKNNMIPYHNII